MWKYQCNMVPDNDLEHTGVIGMKWGHRMSSYKQRSNVSLTKKASNYDIKAARLTRKSEKHHANKDLETSNKMAKKSANYSIRSSKLEKAANKTDNDFKRAILEKRSENLAYKSAKAKMKANRISKTKGYGIKAMRYSIKSDKMTLKAAAARKKIAGNELYTARLNRKISSLTKEELAGAYAFLGVTGTVK